MNHSSSTIAHELQMAGLRATRQRCALLKVLDGSKEPVPVERIVRASRGAFDTATAYRMLEAFQEAGLARRIELLKGHALYERAGRHHHHAVCRSCGTIRDVEACLPKSLDGAVAKASGFAYIDEHALEFFGICTKCAS